MSAPHIVDSGGWLYTVVDDLTVSLVVIATGAVRDEISGLPLPAPLSVIASRPDIFVKTLDNGLYALSAYVEEAFPNLTTTAYSFQVSLVAPGYRDAAGTVNIPAATVFPVPAPSPALRANTLRLQGRVVQQAGTHPSIANALVRATTAGLFSARTPIHFSHAAGTTIRGRTLTPTGASKLLIEDTPWGASRIVVDNTAGIVANTLLRLGTDIEAEYVVAAGLGAPGEVLLTGPLARSFRSGASVRRHNRGGTGVTRTLARSADAGDGLLLCSGAISAATVEIVDGAATEYTTLGALSDAAGFYALDGTGGVTLAEFTASAGGFSDLPVDLELNYSQPVNILDFRLKP